MIKTQELTPVYDSRKSFYGKAQILRVDEAEHLISYDTRVATYKLNGEGEMQGMRTFSSTTLSHIKEFLKQRGFKAESKAQIEKEYIK